MDYALAPEKRVGKRFDKERSDCSDRIVSQHFRSSDLCDRMETVSVNIYNSEYKLRGDDADAIRRAASLVDEQMKLVASKAPMQPATTNAVIASLNMAERIIADEKAELTRSDEMIARLNDLNRRLGELADS